MQFIIEVIRKVVILVLLMEVVLQLQSGKQYEPYIKMLVGVMVVYSLVRGIFGAWGVFEGELKEFQWTGNWYEGFQHQAEKEVENQTVQQPEDISSGIIQPVEIEIQTNIEPIGNIIIEKQQTGEE